MRVALVALLILAPIILAEMPDIDELVEKQKKVHEKIRQILDSAQKNEEGLATRDEYARLIFEIMTQSGNSEKKELIQGIVDEYKLSLPEHVSTQEILEDIGFGEFSKLYMKKIHEFYKINRDL
jgi:hypothetical protein